MARADKLWGKFGGVIVVLMLATIILTEQFFGGGWSVEKVVDSFFMTVAIALGYFWGKTYG